MPIKGPSQVIRCAWCSVRMRVKPSVAAKGHGKTCSRHCFKAYRLSLPATHYRRPTVVVAGKQKLVSRETMERHLGRPLTSDEIVHHLNGDPFDNAITNLQIVTRAEHKRLHPEIGVATRLRKQWNLDVNELRLRLEIESAKEIAQSIGCSERTIRRAIKPQGAHT